MSYVFPQWLLAELKALCPAVDVDHEARAAQLLVAAGKVRNPEGFLRAACKSPKARKLGARDGAEALDTYPSGVPIVTFTAEGTCQTGGLGLADPLTRFVDGCVTARRRGYDPDRIARGILNRPEFAGAFPSASDHWLGRTSWDGVRTATSAERCIVDAGLGAGGSERVGAASATVVAPPEAAPEFAW